MENIIAKAKSYIAQIRKDYPKEIFSTTSVIADYTAGYNQAVTDQSDTLTQYKEALRELVNNIKKREFTELFEDLIIKAKQLLNNE